jgi:hypothetical protein
MAKVIYLRHVRPAASAEPYLASYYRAAERAHAEEAMVLGHFVLSLARRIRALFGRPTRPSIVS